MNNLKKRPTKQLEKFSTIFTQLGLVLVLFIVFITLEHQTEQESVAIWQKDTSKTIYIEPEQNIRFVKEKKPVSKVKKLPIQKRILEKIIKGDNDVIETIIDDPTEDYSEIDIDKLVEIEEPEEKGPETVPFLTIENAPVFKGCEGLSEKENKDCFDKKMKQFVQRNFNAELANELGLQSGRHKIQTQFVINKNGEVVDIQIRAPHKELTKETERLLKKLPKFKPGRQRDTPVKVRYTLPISFNVE
ncbi:MAG: energy transducer TonB [Polaribacter sp.]